MPQEGKIRRKKKSQKRREKEEKEEENKGKGKKRRGRRGNGCSNTEHKAILGPLGKCSMKSYGNGGRV